MKSVESVSGRIPEPLKVVLCIVFAYLSFLLTMYIDVKPILDAVFPFKVPFKILPVLGGFWYVFWISLAYRIAGRWYGLITAVMIVSFCLIASPWFGIVKVSWFSVVGLISFIALGILTELVNGGVANVVCVGINWLGYYIAIHRYISPIGCVVMLVLAFLSGLAGDYAGRGISKVVIRFLKSS